MLTPDETACGATCELGTCTLAVGHDLGHQDERDPDNMAQWFDRSTEYEPGAYASIQPGDKAYRHEYGKCDGPYPKRMKPEWCPWCLRSELREARATIAGAVSALDHWKTPLLNPDGRDDSEAAIRLLANDLRAALDA